jgi:hypothetical protein
MTEETKAGLKVLAEYMGYIVGDLDKETVEEFGISYNTSWDALVPVYAKWYKESKNITETIIDYLGIFYNAIVNNNPQAAFEAVVELVKLINKEKE